MSDLPFSTQIPSPQLAEIIKVYFDDEELRDLCFALSIDYEVLPGRGKGAKARELVQYMERRDLLDTLIQHVRRLRPHIGVNLGKVLNNALPADDPQRAGVDSLLKQLRHFYEKLYEWKELHNHLDGIINIFPQFSAQVERLTAVGEPIADLNALDLAWQPIQRNITVLLIWAEQDVKHIGKPYLLLADGTRTGEKWAVELAMQHDMINSLLHKPPAFMSEKSSGGWSRFVGSFSNQPSPQAAEWRYWWQNVRENTRVFDNNVRSYMFLADKELRKTALELHDFSKETLWG